MQLIADTGAATLPVLSVEVPARLFFGLAPVVLFVSFHLYLQRLWETLADLPAVFPSGVTLDRKTYPWLLNDLVRGYFPHLKKTRRPLAWSQELMFGFLAYWLIPLSLLPVWAR